MANEKILDMTKSAAANEAAVNNKFEELGQGGGGITLDDLKAQVTEGEYGASTIVGDNVEIPTTPARLIEDVNTIRMIKDMRDSVLNVSGDYGHEPQMLIHNGKAYIAYMYHEQGTDEGWGSSDNNYKPKTRLSIVNLSTMAVEKSVMIAKVGDTYTEDGVTMTINTAGSPNIALIGNDTIRVLFSGNVDILYRDYSISNDSLGSIGVCTITKDGTTLSATLPHFKTLIENAGSTLQVHSQYAKVGNKYYISMGNGTSGKNGNIFTTEDFINYTWFAKPSIPAIGENLGLEFEIAVYPWFDAWNYVSLYLAIRRSSGTGNMIVAKMHTGLKYVNNQFVEGDKAAGSIDGYKIIPCNSSRPCFFTPAGSVDFIDTKGQNNLFIAYDNKGQTYPYREYTDVCFLKKNTFADSTVRRISQCLRMTYPSIVYHDGYYYVAYQGYTTGNQPHVLLSKFRPFSANWDKVIATLAKMLDTFEPSES